MRWTWPRRLLVAYLVLLAASHLVRWLAPPDPPERAERRSIEVAEVVVESIEPVESIESIEPTRAPSRRSAQAVRETGETIELAWRDWPIDAAVETGAPVVLLLHGSPGSADDFARLGPLLAAEGVRVVAPDLPGFGASSRSIADYSIRAHARYARDLVEHLELDDVHVVGFSLGGGVALHLALEAVPERVASLTLLAATGVQELELLGEPTLNHAIHAGQLALFVALREAVPHFGALDHTMLGVPYARNFYDTDQRPLRRLLESWREPMLILHGRDDMMVPYEAALEHRRIVPQSELVTFEANHFLPFTRPQDLVEPLVGFVRRVEAGEAATRADAAPARIAAARDGEPFELPRAAGPTLLVWMVLLALATLVSEDLTCIGAGLLVARGAIGFWPAAAACAIGIFVGDIGLYLVGRLGRPWLDRAPLRWLVKPRQLARSRAFFETRGPWMIFASRFLPGFRIPTYVTAGLLGMSLVRFALWLAIPVALWTPLLVGIARAVGKPLFAQIERFHGSAVWIFLGALVAVWLVLGVARGLMTWTGRRLLLGRWRRLSRWEYWPRWVVYPSLAPRFLLSALRHGPTAFTAVNPGMPAGSGLVGESKGTILERLGDDVAPWERLPQSDDPSDDPSDDQGDERRAAVDRFIDQHGLPIVLKPDVGERGRDVVIIRERDQLGAALERAAGAPWLIQDYVDGVELGIFYVRFPDEERGRILSITDKRLPTVEGDGESTLERLILADERAVAMAPVYLERFTERLDDVPARGEAVRLVDVGTHCRGALFLDGAEHRTPALEDAVERIARGYDGFHFGRFDLKAPSFEHFRRGEAIRVLELNGVSSEATHIYDPKHSASYGWRILSEQWRLAFALGAAQRARGHRGLSLLELIALVVRPTDRSAEKLPATTSRDRFRP